jgi:hypothetical protein
VAGSIGLDRSALLNHFAGVARNARLHPHFVHSTTAAILIAAANFATSFNARTAGRGGPLTG